MPTNGQKRQFLTDKVGKKWPKHAVSRGWNDHQTAKTGIGSVGYTPNSRPPDPPPLSVTPLILALRAPIRHIFAIIPSR